MNACACSPNLHFQTVWVSDKFRVRNSPHSSAQSVEYLISGYLADKSTEL
jgi:hypothetical protein